MLPEIVTLVIVALVVAVVSGVAGYLIRSRLVSKFVTNLEDEAEKRLAEARTRSMEIELEARDQALKLLQEAEAENKRRTQEMSRQESR